MVKRASRRPSSHRDEPTTRRCYVYMLQSVTSGSYYIGYTIRKTHTIHPLVQRMRQHNGLCSGGAQRLAKRNDGPYQMMFYVTAHKSWFNPIVAMQLERAVRQYSRRLPKRSVRPSLPLTTLPRRPTSISSSSDTQTHHCGSANLRRTLTALHWLFQTRERWSINARRFCELPCADPLILGIHDHVLQSLRQTIPSLSNWCSQLSQWPCRVRRMSEATHQAIAAVRAQLSP
jgi:predicted GIY-YIG superfamily endonuclease